MKTRGFTIVELLIVVVIIAILAAITIVSYNGIQQRAKDTQLSNAVNQWEKILKMYKAQGNSGSVVNSGTCLSRDPADFIAGLGLNAGECSPGRTVNSSSMTAIAAAYGGGALPRTVLPTVSYDGETWRGLIAYYTGALYLGYAKSGSTCFASSDVAAPVGNAVFCTRSI
jgi:prepilin-type N-terminal cleavage/methylation domain-containing protein